MAIETGDAIRADNFRGMIFAYAGASAPTGFLLCDGSAVSRTTYAGLFSLIGTTYGAGDGSTTFNVPDLRGRFAIGAGTGQKVAAFVSEKLSTIEGVLSTATHFMLRSYKEHGFLLGGKVEENERLKVAP